MEQFDGYTSDQVRLALRSIPTDIALQLADHQLKELTVGIIELAKQVTKDVQEETEKFMKRKGNL